ncbi:MAG: TIR domain-containing protein [Deltaproteobacteria bacterium]|nr:TIR domain-containing protein [Deltaproteobacteria bacterium]
MAALVKLRLGNIFDGPSDLVVLPCSTGGTITSFVATALQEYRIPDPKRAYELGQVDIMPFTGGENIAQYVAFAASVINMHSTTAAIRLIGTRLGSATQDYSSVRAVSAPLLGAGAGGLRSEHVVDAIAEGFKSKAHPDAILTISILHENVFRRLSNYVKPSGPGLVPQPQVKEPIRVFISYTGATQEQKGWVAGLATYLRDNGIEARLDQWHLREGMDLPQWMTNELAMADRVVIVSDAQYAAKADGRSGGVGWETMIIQGDLLNLPAGNNKYLAIIREQDFEKGVPKYLKTKYCFHCAPADDGREIWTRLLKELYNIDLAPPVGKPPVWV